MCYVHHRSFHTTIISDSRGFIYDSNRSFYRLFLHYIRLSNINGHVSIFRLHRLNRCDLWSNV
ncbi:hypothetical protein AS889_18095 [Pseudomonas putida]|nr:hypothetical protein AS889_18095 [Pseudomonas putida]